MDNKKIELLVEHKADLNHISVSAASVLAKVTRDSEIEKIKKAIKEDFGSGYPSDPKTKAFLEKNFEKYPEIFRKTWSSHKEMINRKFQKSLSDFGTYIETKDKTTDLKLLEQFGYKKDEPKTSHEVARYKGLCTVIMYTTGKILIQGKEKDKKETEKILKNLGFDI